MRLRSIIATLESTDRTLCIVAKRPWSAESEASLVRLDSDYRVPAELMSQGYEYFLEVSVAADEVLPDLGPSISTEQRERAILYYAEYDAFPEWLNALRK